MRRLLVWTALVAGALVWLTGAPAAAHASLLSTDPAEGSVVATAPRQVVLTFNEPVRLSDVQGFDADGDDWSLSGEAQDNRIVVTPQGDPGTGTVVVAWKVISQDGHEVGGALTFSIGAATGGGTSAGPSAGAATPTSVTVLRWTAAGLAGAALIASLVMALVPSLSRRPDVIWNAGLVAALLLAPLHELADTGRGLGGLTDWVVWLGGVTRPSSLLLLAAFALLGAARTVPRRILAATTAAAALVLAGGAAYAWPQHEASAPSSAAPAGPTTSTAELEDAGTVRLTAQQTGRTVALTLDLVDPDGQPLTPFALPSLTIGDDAVSLGDVALTGTGPGAYTAEATIPTAGTWQAQVSVRLTEFDNPVAVLDLQVR